MASPARNSVAPLAPSPAPSRSRLLKLLQPTWWLRRMKRGLASAIQWRRTYFFISQPAAAPTFPQLSLVEVSFSASSDLPWTAETLKARQLAGHQLFALQQGGERVAFAWLSPAGGLEIGELGGHWNSSEPVRWVWDCVTPERYRGRGFYSQLLSGLSHKFSHQKLVIYCDALNEPSKRGILRAGFSPWVTVTGWRGGRHFAYQPGKAMVLSGPGRRATP